MRAMIRGIVDSVVEGSIKRISGAGVAGETFSNREYFQHYGFTSRPLQGAECVWMREGNHIVAIASDDRRYRVEIEEGAVALYDDQGQKVLLGRDNTMEIVCTGTLTASVADDATVTAGQSITATAPLVHVEADEAEVEATTSVTVTSPEVTVVAETKVTLDTPLVECTQDLSVGGSLSVTGDIEAGGDVSDGTRSMALGRQFYNSHYHTSTGSQPTPQQ